MKSVLLLAAVSVMATAARAEKQTAQLERVTIYTDGAQVVRTKAVSVQAGEQTITFTGMSPYMDTNSLQVKATGHLTVLGVSHRTAQADSTARAQAMRKAAQDVEDVVRKIQQLKDERDVISQQNELVKANCSVAGRTVATPLANIKELNNYYAQELLALKKRDQALADQINVLEKEQKRKEHTRDSLLRQKTRYVTEVDVRVTAPQTGRATFRLTYYATNASWWPSYDITSAGAGQPMDLSYKVNIVQNTKEDWQNTDVTLSSANPNRSNVAPSLSTYWLDFNRPVPVYRSKTRDRSMKKVTMDMMVESRPMLAEKTVEAEEEEVESDIIEVHQQQAQFGYEFHIGQQLSLPSQTKAVTTEIARHQLPATYVYKCYPKQDKEAFLVADATDWQRLNLMRGDANVFFENAYVGKSVVDPSQATDTLHFSLGRDPSISVQRTKVNDSSARRFLGSNQEQTVAWRITVKNTRREPVTLLVYDQVPVSRNDDITVTTEELSGGKCDSHTGIVSWQLTLQPGTQQELLLKYKVKYPKNQSVTLE